MSSVIRTMSPRLRSWRSGGASFASSSSNTKPAQEEASAAAPVQQNTTVTHATEPGPPVEVVIGPKSYVFPSTSGLRPRHYRRPPPGRHYRIPRLAIHLPPKKLKTKAWKPAEKRQQQGHLADESPKSVLRRVRRELERRRDLMRTPIEDEDIVDPRELWDAFHPVGAQSMEGEASFEDDHGGWDDIASLDIHSAVHSASKSPSSPSTIPTRAFHSPAVGRKSPIRSPVRRFSTSVGPEGPQSTPTGESYSFNQADHPQQENPNQNQNQNQNHNHNHNHNHVEPQILGEGPVQVQHHHHIAQTVNVSDAGVKVKTTEILEELRTEPPSFASLSGAPDDDSDDYDDFIY